MRLVFLHDPSSLDLRARPDVASRFVGLTWRAQRAIRSLDLPETTLEEILAPHEAALENDARRMQEEWHRDSAGGDALVHEGIPIARAHRTFLWSSVFLPGAKAFRAVWGAIRNFDPSDVHCDAAAGHFFRAALRANGVSVRSFGESRPGIPHLEFLEPIFAWRPRHAGRAAVDRAARALGACARAVGRLRTPNPVPILTSYYPSLDPLFDALLRAPWSGVFQCDFVERPPMRLFHRAVARGMSFDDGARAAETESSRRGGAELLERWRRATSRADSESRFAFEGIPVWPVFSEALEKYLSQALAESLATIARADRLLGRRAYRALLTPIDSMPDHRLLVECARKRGIPTVLAGHGIPYPIRDHAEGSASDHVGIDGPAHREAYRRAGHPESSVLDEGPGIYDASTGAPPPSAAARRRVLVLSCPPTPFSPRSLPGQSERFLEEILAVLRELPVEVTLKIHPAESRPYYEELLRDLGAYRVRLEKDRPFRRVLDSHGIVVGSISTAMVEAAVRGRWVAGAEFGAFPLPPPFDGRCGLPLLRTRAALEKWICEAVTASAPPDYESFLTAYAGPRDGRQADRFLDRLRRICAPA